MHDIWSKSEIWIGLDEAGVGTLAGPLVAAIVALPKTLVIDGVRDSKKMTDLSRENLVDAIYEKALFHEIVFADSPQVDKEGVWNTWDRLVIDLVLSARMKFPKHEVLIDGNRVSRYINNVTPIIKGDVTHHCISAASVLAKYGQCCSMDALHKQYPRYGFDNHRGYGTPEHLTALEKYGPCPAHRMSYQPVRDHSR